MKGSSKVLSDIKDTIIKNLITACRLKKIKNKDVSEYLGVSKGSVTNWFRGTNFIDIENLYKLCKFLEISLDWVFGLSPNDSSFKIEEEEINLINSYRGANTQARQDAISILESHQEKDIFSKAE